MNDVLSRFFAAILVAGGAFGLGFIVWLTIRLLPQDGLAVVFSL